MCGTVQAECFLAILNTVSNEQISHQGKEQEASFEGLTSADVENSENLLLGTHDFLSNPLNAEVIQEEQNFVVGVGDATRHEATQQTIAEAMSSHTLALLETQRSAGERRDPVQVFSPEKKRLADHMKAMTKRFWMFMGVAVQNDVNNPDTEKVIEEKVAQERSSQSTEGSAQWMSYSARAVVKLEAFRESIKQFIGIAPEKAVAVEDVVKNLENRYGSIILETVRRMNTIRERMKYIGEANYNFRMVTSLTTLVPFMLGGEVRQRFSGTEVFQNFEFAQKALWWLGRTSRRDVINRRGEIKEDFSQRIKKGEILTGVAELLKTPQDEFLRMEQSSFPLACEIEPMSLGKLLAQKLERYAENKHEYHLDVPTSLTEDGDKDRVKILVWFSPDVLRRDVREQLEARDGKAAAYPRYINVPLAWFDDPGKSFTATNELDRLLMEARDSLDIGLNSYQMDALRTSCYGKFSEQSSIVKDQILQADFSVVVGEMDIHNPREIMENPAFVTGGARMRECVAVNVKRKETTEDDIDHEMPHEFIDTFTIDGLVQKTAHVYVDGLGAKDILLKKDLRKREVPTQIQSLHPADAYLDPKHLNRELLRNWQPEIELEYFPEETQKEYIGYEKVSREKSQFWIDAVSVLRLITGEKFGLADLMSYAQMLSSRTRGSHFLESHTVVVPEDEGDKAYDVLDVAYNVLTDKYLLAFDHYLRKTAGENQRLTSEDVEIERQKDELKADLLVQMRFFKAERALAKQGKSLASYMSTLAGSIKNVEQIMRTVSKNGKVVGELITEAVGNPRGGLISMLADPQRLPVHQAGEPNILWFASANTDVFIPTSEKDNHKSWGGALGISSTPEGFVFTVRKLGLQSLEPREQGVAEARLRTLLQEKIAEGNNLEGKTLQEIEGLLAEYDTLTQDIFKLQRDPNRQSGFDESVKVLYEMQRNLFGNVKDFHTFAKILREKVLKPYVNKRQKMQEQSQKNARTAEVQAQVEDIPKALDFLLTTLAGKLRSMDKLQALVQYFQERQRVIEDAFLLKQITPEQYRQALAQRDQDVKAEYQRLLSS